MAKQNLTGKWVGRYSYGSSYGSLAGVAVYFEMDLIDDGVVIRGTCLDDEHRNLFSDPAVIEGSCTNSFISFVKKYPHATEFDAKMRATVRWNEPSQEVFYTGTLRTMLFSKRNVFRGEWQINTPYEDKDGNMQYFTNSGRWTMERAD